MGQVFLSYSSLDRALAVQVAARLTERGISIWYDDALQTGTAYRSAIRRAIDSASVVCVLWTTAASQSAWVKDEAATGNRRGILFSVACGRSAVPASFRRSIFARIGHPERGPTASEVSNLVRGLSHMLAAAAHEDRFSAKKLLSRLVDFLSTSSVLGALAAGVILSQAGTSKAPIVSGPLSLTVVSAVIGLALGGVGFASSRLGDHLAMKYLSISLGPSGGRLLYRWAGEAAGCAVLLVFVMSAKGASSFSRAHPDFLARLVLGLLVVWLILMLALGVKYLVFIACRRCRYFLLT
jgi:hypothetical protein